MTLRVRSGLAAAFILALAGPAQAAPKAPPAAPPAATAPGPADWRTPDPQDVLVIDTNRGRIFLE
ncbi:MAG: peptidylprolyl isomerase, partial [Phenylobacterium sp.]